MPATLDVTVVLAKADLLSRRLSHRKQLDSAPTLSLLRMLSWQQNGVVHCLPGEVPEIYSKDEEQERKDRLLTMHTSAESGNNQRVDLFQYRDSGFTEEEDEEDDTNREIVIFVQSIEASTMQLEIWIVVST